MAWTSFDSNSGKESKDEVLGPKVRQLLSLAGTATEYLANNATKRRRPDRAQRVPAMALHLMMGDAVTRKTR